MEVTYTAALCCLLLPLTAAADTGGKLFGDVSDGSRAIPVHRLTLRDEQGQRILSDDEPPLPFSTRETCGRCHSCGLINRGRHFSSVDANVAPGRVGQPWIYVDGAAVTQIPISYRPWPGTYRPAQLGMTSWQFTQSFGRQSPGGGAGGLESEKPEEVMRQFVSGNLEINCLSCHSAHPAYDQAEYAGQIDRENLRWAVTAACGFASVTGAARDMPDTYDPLMGDVPDDPKLIPPKVTYQKTAFDEKNRVHFEIAGEPAAERCYFCHSRVVLGAEEWEKWPTDEDVHLTAGMTCVDCHRNGLEHKMIRGYENEALETQNLHAAGLSCKGCHLGEESSPVPLAGRMGAPVPKHNGIPSVHFEKLTCTACHSGPWPEQGTVRLKTSRAHALGTRLSRKSPEALPHIIYPVFAAGDDGRIAPNALLWPAFWADIQEGKVLPLSLDAARSVTTGIIGGRSSASGDWADIGPEQIAKVLAAISSKSLASGQPGYICGGKLYQLDGQGGVISEEHDAAKPYLWPIAHNVKGAAQALGVRTCRDCHDLNSPFFFGRVEVDSPVTGDRDSGRTMIEYEGIDPVFTKLFAVSFISRPLFKFVLTASATVIAAVLMLYSLKALAFITDRLGRKNN
jgi:nitrate/TMAO reductase-like tetraheme cytochrome c subunit